MRGQWSTGKTATHRSTVSFSGTIFLGAEKGVRGTMSRTKESFFCGAEILIAEDSPTQAEQLTHYLNTLGYTVTVARDGKQALAAALRSKPALVISDVVMPQIHGCTLCKEIQSNFTLHAVPDVLPTTLST